MVAEHSNLLFRRNGCALACSGNKSVWSYS